MISFIECNLPTKHVPHSAEIVSNASDLLAAEYINFKKDEMSSGKL